MLGFAINHEERLMELHRMTWLNERFKFFNISPHAYQLEVVKCTNMQHQFVSIDPVNYMINGLIGYYIDRDINAVTGVYVVRFGGDPMVFASDLLTALKGIFEKYNFNKINFSVIIGNPVEKQYDKIVKRFGGRIVGTYSNDVKLFDGKLYDRKIYEITKKDYMNTKRHRIKAEVQSSSSKHSLKSLPFYPPKNLLDTIKPNEDIFMDSKLLKDACELSDILLEVQTMIKEKEDLQAKANLEKADDIILGRLRFIK